MSYLLEILGRGLIAHLRGAFDSIFPEEGEESTDALIAFVEANPEDVEAGIRLGCRYLRADDPVAARKLFIKVLGLDKKCFRARLGLACVFDELNQLDAALEQLRIVQKVDPLNPAILFCLGYCNEKLGHEADAVHYYQGAIEFCPTLRNAHERLAAIYLKNGETDSAIIHFERLCDLDPEQTDLHLTLAGLHMKAGNHEEAIDRYQHALALEPDNWSAHNDVVSAYEEAGLVREAIEHLHKMIDAEEDEPDTRLRLGDLYARVGDDVAAAAHYKRAVKLCPDYLEANVKLGTLHLRAGRFREAARSFSSALEINDRLLSAYVGIGVAHHAEGRNEEAMSSFQMARDIEPNSTLLFSEVARMQLKASAGRYSKDYLSLDIDTGKSRIPAPTTDLISQQIERLNTAIRQRPNYADLHYRLGMLLRNRGQIEDAASAFRRAVEINPTYMKALIKLGLALKELDRVDEAIAVLKQATEIQPQYLDLHYQLGLMFAQRHQFEMAVEHFERAVQGNATNVEFNTNLALALQNMGLVDRAKATWQFVCELAPDSPEAAHARIELARQK